MSCAKEFLRLKDICYLDHAGSTLYSEKQIEAIMEDYCSSVYGNPHSLSVTSRQTTDVVDQIRFRVLQHFNTDTDEYDVVFTSGATAALKLVAESFDFKSDPNCPQNEEGVFVYTQDNHTSVLGMRDAVKHRCSDVICLSLTELDKTLNNQSSISLEEIEDFGGTNSLLVYPAQCNFSGLKNPLSWIQKCQNNNLQDFNSKRSNWYCLLDAASLVSTSDLDLSLYKPDFVALSFYKIFGYPSGLGALLVRKSSGHTLTQRSYYGGGTVLMAMSSLSKRVLRPVLHERLEDGTLPFLSIIAIRHGLDTLVRLGNSMKSIQNHTFHLARRLHHSLKALHHYNGQPVVQLYCDTDFEDPDTQGPIVNFNLLRPNGDYVGFVEVLNMANSHKIQLRTGCFCNPGACQRHLKLRDEDLESHFQAGHVCGDERDLINGTPTGSVRVSIGYMSSEADVDTILSMIYNCFVIRDHTHNVNSVTSSLEDKWFDATDNIHAEIHSSQSIDTAIRKAQESNTHTLDVEKNRIAHSNEESLGCEATQPKLSLSQIVLFPVKSCGGFRPKTPWMIGPRGLAYDRTWMVVTAAGTALTQTQEPKLACIRPTLDLNTRTLHLSFDGHEITTSVPLDEDTSERYREPSLCQSKVCGDRVKGRDCGDEIARWLTLVLQRQGLRLVRQLNEDHRLISGTTNALGLANKAQFLMVSETSVSWLGKQIPPDECNLSGLLDRFRANLVIHNISDPFEEVNWKRIQIGKRKFKVEGPCTRCGVVCVDQTTGQRTNEPLRTLSALLHSKVRFGVYLSHLPQDDYDGMDVISVGDEVTVA